MSSLKNKVIIVVLLLVLTACQGVQVLPVAQAQPTAPSKQAELAPTVMEQPGVVPTFPATATAPPPTALPPSVPLPTATAVPTKNAAALQQVGQVSFDNPARLVWSPDGSTLAVMSNTQLQLLDGKTLVIKGSAAFKAPIVLLDVSADGRSMASTSDQATVELRNVTDGKTRLSLKPDAPFSSLAFSPDGKTLALTSVDEIAATLWQVDSGKQVAKLSGFQSAAPVYDVSFTPNGKSLVWHARALVQLMDIASQKLGPAFEHEDFVSALSVSSDGSLLATSAGGTVDGNFIPLVNVWDTASGKALAKLKPADVCTALNFSPGSHLLAGGSGNQVILWDADTQQQTAVLQGHTDRVDAIAFSPDGKLLATAAADNTVRIWQLKP